ncbi:hypothetical protein BIW11_07143 [Tropilaelaps mercedesae]|uniref:Uncharacterized protein n=1 Tax=Tropilaelaps mercedesae TaxID=418985 RepID=A0A1V9XVH6_9ACAR|nr:hypothetical protein BIW11_07143 [Tropilaelaps mercedesae]
MGSVVSKHFGEYEPVSTPPQLQRQLNLDPRSPSSEINRSPIIVPVTPDDLKKTPARAKPNPVLDPRSPAKIFSRTPVLAPIKFDFTDLEQALKNSSNKIFHVSPKNRTEWITINRCDLDKANLDANIEPAQIAQPTTPSKSRGLSTTSLVARSPNIASQPIEIESLSVKDTYFKETEYTPLKVATGGRSNLRQMAHHQSHVRGKRKTQRGLSKVQDENSPFPIRL